MHQAAQDSDGRSEHDISEEENSNSETRNRNNNRPKQCKKCSFKCVDKVEYWDHVKIHIPPDKILTCSMCPFVTEHKHHLEYHINNHSGNRPYKCSVCSYSCINKAMLTSHVKSHSNIYPFRCQDCHYASKYMHQLKQHLRRHSHKPAPVLNPDGTPNHAVTVDVYGSRRGPRTKPQTNPTQERPSQIPDPFSMLCLPIFFPMLQNYMQYRMQMESRATIVPTNNIQPPVQEETTEDGVLDLRKPETKARELNNN